MNINNLLDGLGTRLALITSKLQLNAKVGRFNDHVDYEDLMIDLINITHDLKLTNANKEHSQFPGVDAIDKTNGVLVQITTDTSANKVIKSLTLSNKHELFLDGINFKMAYLKDKKPFTPKSIQNIKSKIGKFKFEPDRDFYTLDGIYKSLYKQRDLRKMENCLSILDNYLDYLPSGKSSGITALAISFHEEGSFNDTRLLIEQLLKEHINVFIHSKKMYDDLKARDSKYTDYLIYAEHLQLDYVKHFLIIISERYITANLNDEPSCTYLSQIMDHEVTYKVISFYSNINIPQTDLGNRLINYISLTSTREELEEFSRGLFSNFFHKAHKHIPIDINLLLVQLANNFSNFEPTIIEDSKIAVAVLYTMRDDHEMRQLYVIARPDYTNTGLREFISTIKKTRKEKIHILIPKNPSHKTRKALLNVEKENRPKTIKYIDEYLFEKTAEKFKQEPMQVIEDFVHPAILKNGKIKYLNDIINWINDEEVPSIGIIKAGGGIGKTTLAEKIHDILIDNLRYQFLVVFINSGELLREFRNANFDNLGEYDLYNLFKKAHPQGNTLDETSFYNNYSQGNILMILDGIDEIISSVASFTLVNFLNKLDELNKRIGRGKILITCRDFYMEEIDSFLKSKGNNSLHIYHLLAFNMNIAKQYLKKHELSDYKRNKGIKLLKRFVPETKEDNTEFRYPPYVLEVIIDMLENEEDDGLKLEELFDSKLLIDGYPSDYIFIKSSVERS